MLACMYKMINKDKLEMMAFDKTIQEIKNIKDPERSKRLMYIIKNCSSYMVTPQDNEHWLCGSLILTKWQNMLLKSVNYQGCDPFETWSFHNDEIAGDVFKTHHEMENA